MVDAPEGDQATEPQDVILGIVIDCPVCHEGESVGYDRAEKRVRVWCSVCGTSGPWEDDDDSAATWWNKLFAEPASEGHNADEEDGDGQA